MLPLHRWLVCAVGVLMSSGALAQAAATPPTIDESKLPEWVKRQGPGAVCRVGIGVGRSAEGRQRGQAGEEGDGGRCGSADGDAPDCES